MTENGRETKTESIKINKNEVDEMVSHWNFFLLTSSPPFSKVVQQFFIRGYSSNKPFILRINVLWGNSDLPHPLFCCLNERAQKFIASPRLWLVPASMQGRWACFVSQVRRKKRRKGEDGAIKLYNFLLSPKSPNDKRNIPFWYSPK